MRKTVLATFVVTIALGCVVAQASARNLSISNTDFRIVWTPMAFTSAAQGTVACDLTMEGTLHSRTIVKTNNLLIGYITRARINHTACAEGDVFMLNGTESLAGVATIDTLPWHVRYVSFTGRLPDITGVRVNITNMSFLVRRLIQCLFRSTAAEPAFGTFQVTAGVITGFKIDETIAIPRFNGLGCSAGINLTGTGAVMLLGTSTPITLRLI